MNEKILASITFSLFITCSVNADELVPATSEDVSDFETLVTNQAASEARALHQRPDRPIKEPMKENMKETTKLRKDNFGLLVSTEAKRLKDSAGDNKKELGRWVSEQRRKDGNNVGSGGSLGGSSGSVSTDARSAARGKKSSDRDSRNGRHGESKK